MTKGTKRKIVDGMKVDASWIRSKRAPQLSTLSDEEKSKLSPKQLRRYKNRVSAEKSRLRKKLKMKRLETQVDRLREENRRLRRELEKIGKRDPKNKEIENDSISIPGCIPQMHRRASAEECCQSFHFNEIGMNESISETLLRSRTAYLVR